MTLRIASLAVFALAAVCARADVRLPALVSDHMVLQRDMPVRVWGKASPGERVSVTFRGDTRSATANGIGRWAVYLAPQSAGGPFDLLVQGRNAITVHDVLVGEVWLASGQSNMEMPLDRVDGDAREVAAAQHPRMRFFRFPHRVSNIPMDNVWGSWKAVTPDSIADNSAVAYFFAREIQEKLQVPIGIIQSAWGGTPAEAWTSAAALASDPELLPIRADWARALERYPDAAVAFERDIGEWEKAVAAAKAAGRQPPEKPRGPLGPGHPYTPSGLYNAMIAPLTPYAIRGVIWYQGEANAGLHRRAVLYRRLFPALISDWRRAWAQGSFPFLFVQLANYQTREDADWPAVREAQLLTLELRNTAMAVTIDIGDARNIHPRNKRDVGHRLALAARATVYDEPVEYSGPIYRQMSREGNAIRLWFDHAASGLVGRGGELRGFSIAGPNRRLVPARARIEGETVLVSSPDIAAPAAVRYAWADNPACNLYNGAGLPASPFRTDTPR